MESTMDWIAPLPAGIFTLATLYMLVLFFHIGAGTAAIFSFFIPLLSKKGNRLHRRAGNTFVISMKCIAISGVFMALILFFSPYQAMSTEQLAQVAELEPTQVLLNNRFSAIFLGYLSVVVFVGMVYGTRVLDVREQRLKIKTPAHWLLWMSPALASAGILWAGITFDNLLYKLLAIIGFSNSVGYWNYLRRANVRQNAWLLEHINAMIGGGIACFTAFAVTGGDRLFAAFLTTEGLRILPWVLPTALGVPAIFYAVHYYGNKYRIFQAPRV